MLDRRAAGVLPRNQKGAELVIPIFCRGSCQASFILVQVENLVGSDEKFPDSALANLLPRTVSETNHPLHAVPEYEMIRLYMNLQEELTRDKPAQSVVTPEVDGVRSRSHKKEEEDTKPPPFSCSLCVRGMFAPTSDADDSSQTLDEIRERWPFLSKELIKQLRVIACSAWWDGKAQVKYDLESREVNEAQSGCRPLSRVLAKETALERASKTLSPISSVGRG
ncbi:hypothetical protein PHYPSEUDO_010975 [Phytophthora pseudosyringae]|uniref:Uncharacterized protein n=1 Tax=Phytophthora pseudosyringae TaxID=221518 RepID=A0A8T1WAU2_9STRA|nr:hypothetical protein PHYPSEUDO_010975 [Phytophthora pseudosyringae]